MATTSRVRSRRSSARFIAHAQRPNFMPMVMGSAWMPCVRPTHSMSRVSNARRLQISPMRRTSAMRMSVACVIW